MSDARWSDRKIVLWMIAIIVVLIVAVSVLAPNSGEDDSRPSTYNTGPNGAKAAYLMLQAIGRTSTRWERPLAELSDADASQTTLVLAEPLYSPMDHDRIAAGVKSFMQRGGRVLTTGPTGALLLPDGSVKPPTIVLSALCHTKPADGSLAGAGSVTMIDTGAWAGKGKAEIAQRCGDDAVVVRMQVGRGEAVWWSSATPLTNDQLRTDADLRLLLLSVGEGHAVLWDESLQEPVPGLWSKARGLPLGWLLGQIALVIVLLVLSFSRRNGPMRMPVTVPRSSPVEFALSMGDLYAKARATTVVIEAARRRLLRAMTREAGVAYGVIESGTRAVVSALNERLGGNWSLVGEHLDRAEKATRDRPTSREALAIARALSEDAEKIRAAARGRRGEPKRAMRVA
jgi:hypothetical protein